MPPKYRYGLKYYAQNWFRTLCLKTLAPTAQVWHTHFCLIAAFWKHFLTAPWSPTPVSKNVKKSRMFSSHRLHNGFNHFYKTKQLHLNMSPPCFAGPGAGKYGLGTRGRKYTKLPINRPSGRYAIIDNSLIGSIPLFCEVSCAGAVHVVVYLCGCWVYCQAMHTHRRVQRVWSILRGTKNTMSKQQNNKTQNVQCTRIRPRKTEQTTALATKAWLNYSRQHSLFGAEHCYEIIPSCLI